MDLENNQWRRWKQHLQAVPVCLAALAMWAVFGGWYIAVVPANVAGADNMGIVISVLGLCLFISDRLALRWFNRRSRMVVCSVWVWGLALVLWGLVAWLPDLSGRYVSIFAAHWLVVSILIVSTWLWVERGRARPD